MKRIADMKRVENDVHVRDVCKEKVLGMVHTDLEGKCYSKREVGLF